MFSLYWNRLSEYWYILCYIELRSKISDLIVSPDYDQLKEYGALKIIILTRKEKYILKSDALIVI